MALDEVIVSGADPVTESLAASATEDDEGNSSEDSVRKILLFHNCCTVPVCSTEISTLRDHNLDINKLVQLGEWWHEWDARESDKRRSPFGRAQMDAARGYADEKTWRTVQVLDSPLRAI